MKENMAHTECKDDEGIVVGLLDGLIATARVLHRNYSSTMSSSSVQEALADLADDKDLKWLLDQRDAAKTHMILQPIEDGKYQIYELSDGFMLLHRWKGQNSNMVWDTRSDDPESFNPNDAEEMLMLSSLLAEIVLAQAVLAK